MRAVIFDLDGVLVSTDEYHFLGWKRVADEEALTLQLNAWLANPAARTAIAEAGAKTVRQLGGALDRTLAALDPYLVQLRLEQRAS